jgi:hypothetical protein
VFLCAAGNVSIYAYLIIETYIPTKICTTLTPAIAPEMVINNYLMINKPTVFNVLISRVFRVHSIVDRVI